MTEYAALPHKEPKDPPGIIVSRIAASCPNWKASYSATTRTFKVTREWLAIEGDSYSEIYLRVCTLERVLGHDWWKQMDIDPASLPKPKVVPMGKMTSVTPQASPALSSQRGLSGVETGYRPGPPCRVCGGVLYLPGVCLTCVSCGTSGEC